MARGDFFLIQKSVLPDLARLGMNALVTYLVLARGTSRDNRRTAWSTNAVERKTDIGRVSARNAIRKLEQGGFLDIVKEGKRPVYRLTDSPSSSDLYGYDNGFDYICLPNSIVDGVGAETPPIEKLRRSGWLELLELFLGLYDLQNLAEAHGVHWSVYRKNYQRTKVRTHGKYTVWGFTEGSRWVHRVGPLKRFFDRSGADPEKIWEAFNQFEKLGLIESSAIAVEGLSEDCAVIYPVDPDFNPEFDAALRRLTDRIVEGGNAHWAYEKHDIVSAIPSEYTNVQVVEIYRTRYRAKTSLSASWIASRSELTEVAVFMDEYTSKLT